MTNSLERLLAGMMATLRQDVIPHVSDPYARGQAIGVIDILNNIASRIEWARAPLLAGVEGRRAIIEEVLRMVPAAPKAAQPARPDLASLTTSAALAAERDRLDGEIADLLIWATRRNDDADAAAAAAKLRQFIHDDVAAEMKLTKKPLFAEISRGGQHDKDRTS